VLAPHLHQNHNQRQTQSIRAFSTLFYTTHSAISADGSKITLTDIRASGLGCGGIIVSGGDVHTLTPSHIVVANCSVTHYARFNRACVEAACARLDHVIWTDESTATTPVFTGLASASPSRAAQSVTRHTTACLAGATTTCSSATHSTRCATRSQTAAPGIRRPNSQPTCVNVVAGTQDALGFKEATSS
jgi:hypothetical protein